MPGITFKKVLDRFECSVENYFLSLSKGDKEHLKILTDNYTKSCGKFYLNWTFS